MLVLFVRKEKKKRLISNSVQDLEHDGRWGLLVVVEKGLKNTRHMEIAGQNTYQSDDQRRNRNEPGFHPCCTKERQERRFNAFTQGTNKLNTSDRRKETVQKTNQGKGC